MPTNSPTATTALAEKIGDRSTSATSQPLLAEPTAFSDAAQNVADSDDEHFPP
jgi:hypothetical protein